MKYLLTLTLFFSLTINTFATEIVHDESDSRLKEGRQRWIEDMHRTEPGVDWKILDAESWNMKRKLRQEKIQSLLDKGINPRLQTESTIADGMIKGEWRERGSRNNSGRVHTADIDWQRELIYVGTSGGNIWRGTIDGKNWTCLNNTYQLNDIKSVVIMQYNGKNRILAAHNSAPRVVYSDDEGLTWHGAEGLELQYPKRLLINSSGDELFLLGQYQNVSKVYSSTDGGSSFNLIRTEPMSYYTTDIWAPRQYDDLYLIAGPRLMKYSGGEFEQISEIEFETEGNVNSFYLSGNFEDGNESFYLKTYTTEADGTRWSVIYNSSDGGSSWWSGGFMKGVNTFKNNSFAASLADPEVCYFGEVNIWKSNDEGFTFKEITNWTSYYLSPETRVHADVPGIHPFIQPDGSELILICTDGGLFRSYNGMQTFENISLEGLNCSQYYSTYTSDDAEVIYAGAQDQGFQKCLKDSGTVLSFEQSFSGDYGHISSSNGGRDIWTTYPYSVHFIDKANTATAKHVGSPLPDGYGHKPWIMPIIPDPDDSETAYCAFAQSGGLYIWRCNYMADGVGYTKHSSDLNSLLSNKVNALTFSPHNSNLMYALDDAANFFTSTDKGKTWSKKYDGETVHGAYLYGASILPSKKDPNTIYIAGSGYSTSGMYRTEDGGVTFTGLDNGLPNTHVYDIAMSPDEMFIFAATDVGPYVYSVHRNQWFDMMAGDAPEQTYWTVEFVDKTNTVRFGTYGRGVWDFAITEMNDIEKGTENFEKLTEITASPNPLRSATTINFTSEIAQPVTARVFRPDGKLAATLFDGMAHPGVNSLTWSPDASLPNGVYLCVVTTPVSSSYVKLIIE